MGTRGLTVVYMDGKHVVAQFGSSDHYPEGHGLTVLEFCRSHLTTKKGCKEFRKHLGKVKFSQDEKELEASTFEVKDGKSRSYDHSLIGADILQLIWDAPKDKTICLEDAIKFAKDKLFCEYAYVISLDANTFEVFKNGFSQPRSKYDLNNLPSKEVFLEELKD